MDSVSSRRARQARAGLLAALVCAFGSLGPSASGATHYGDISVTAEPPPVEESPHGYLEYRITIVNRSIERGHDVALIFPQEEYGGGDCVRRISRSVKVGSSSTVRVSLLQPPLRCLGNGLAVAVDGRTQREPVYMSASYSRHSRYGYYDAFLVLVSRGTDRDFTDAAKRALGSASSSFGRGSVECFVRSESPLADWSTDWLGYSCFDGIVVKSDELNHAPAAVRSALWQHVECGGTLLVLGEADVPETWRSRWDISRSFARCYAGFGQCVVTPEAEFAQWGRPQWQALFSACSESLSPFQEERNVETANAFFPVVEGLAMPVRGLLALMVLFVIVIGPLNLWLLWLKKKRIWLLWTVPAISLLTCGAVTLYAAIAEGWHGRVRTTALTILDQKTHRATTIGWTAFYSPVTPGGGLHFGYETELTPQIGGDPWGWGYSSRSSGRARELDWTHDQHLATGWVSARVPAHFMLRKSEARRERLAVRRARDGTLTAVNGLGAPIRTLWFADERGDTYAAIEIPAGAEVALNGAGPLHRAGGSVDDLHKAFATEWLGSIEQMRLKPVSFLRPGCYIALLDEAPFVEQGLPKAKSLECDSVIYGIVEEIAHED